MADKSKRRALRGLPADDLDKAGGGPPEALREGKEPLYHVHEIIHLCGKVPDRLVPLVLRHSGYRSPMEARVNVSVDPEDHLTRDLARTLLLMEVVTEVVTVAVVLAMIDKGQFLYRLGWYWKRWVRQMRGPSEADIRRVADYVVAEATRIVRSEAHG